MICETINCDEAIKPGSKLKKCHLCRASIHAWDKRRPAEILERRQRLAKYDARMATLVPDSEMRTGHRSIGRVVVNINSARKRRHG